MRHIAYASDCYTLVGWPLSWLSHLLIVVVAFIKVALWR